jgi:hypothetical protein
MNTQKLITVLAVGQKHGKSLLTRRLNPKLLTQRLPLTLLGPQPLALLIRQLPTMRPPLMRNGQDAFPRLGVTCASFPSSSAALLWARSQSPQLS